MKIRAAATATEVLGTPVSLEAPFSMKPTPQNYRIAVGYKVKA